MAITPNPFTEKYKAYSNKEIIVIIDNASEYQPLAVTTAVQEFKCRNIPQEEVIRIRNEISSDLEDTERNSLTTKFNNVGKVVLNELIEGKEKTTRKMVRGLCLFLLIDMLFYLFKSSTYGIETLENPANWDALSFAFQYTS